MLSALGIGVLRLVRVAIGPLQLGQLPKGCVRRLAGEEKETLQQAARDQATRAPQRRSRDGVGRANSGS